MHVNLKMGKSELYKNFQIRNVVFKVILQELPKSTIEYGGYTQVLCFINKRM